MKKIIYVGQFTDASGYGSAARKYLQLLDKYLDKSLYDLKVFNSSFERQIFCSKEELDLFKKYELKINDLNDYICNNDYTAVFHLLPWYVLKDFDEKHKNRIIQEKAKESISISYWEFDRLPAQWRDIYNSNIYDKVIVACDWNKQIYSKDINKPLHIVPIPIKNKTINKINNEIFTIFSLSQWMPRKGFDILIKAFYSEFYNNEDVKLFIKTYRSEVTNSNLEDEKNIVFQQALELKSSISHYNNNPKCKLEIKTGVVSQEEIESYYSKADIFCLLSRGEGFSIPMAEAAVRGIPVLSPSIGGHIDFLDATNNFFIDCEHVPLEYGGNNSLFSSLEMNQIEPKINSVKKQLRKVYNIWKEDKNKLLKIGEQSKMYALNYFDEKNLYNKLIKAIG
jgi:glycosyltransferase involved in cell wall biosynthesis